MSSTVIITSLPRFDATIVSLVLSRIPTVWIDSEDGNMEVDQYFRDKEISMIVNEFYSRRPGQSTKVLVLN